MANFDVCELVSLLAQEARMERLLQMLRNSQASCLDNGDCLTDASLSLPGDRSADSGMTLWTIVFVGVLVAVLALLTPGRAVNRPGTRKGGSGDRDGRRDGDSAIF